MFGNWAYGEAAVDFSPMRRKNLPPKLQKDSHSTLTDEATTDFDLDSSKTYITDFRSAYPEYASKIDATTNPTISADYDISMATLGYKVGLFVLVSKNHRIMTPDARVGLSYLNGGYSVNLCDPFRISLEKVDLTLGGSSKQGFCQNKQDLVSFQINEFRASGNAKLIVWSHVGENF